MFEFHRWIATDAPLAGRYDDCFFISDSVGWAINGAGNVYRTDDGARTWQHQQNLEGAYLRCMGMLNQDVGWIGCAAPSRLIFMTENGGTNWTQVPNLPRTYKSTDDADAPLAVCGLHVLDSQHIFASGPNNPEHPARFLKSTDGGVTWKARDMEDVAACLIDIYFQSPKVGWLVGGRSTRPRPRRSDILPVVLKTVDGGASWTNVLDADIQAPLGEWGWKIQFVDDQFVVVALENFKAGAILISEDGGQSWKRIEILDAERRMINGNLEGIGFIDKNVGWVGGWGDVAVSSGRTSGTTDGGQTWIDLTESWPKPPSEGECCNDVDHGQYLNRFRFTDRFGYASGNTVYKFTDEEVETFDPATMDERCELLAAAGHLSFAHRAEIPLHISPGTQSLRVEIYDRFAGKVRTLVDENDPSSGRHVVSWDLTDDGGRQVEARQYLVRAVADGQSESRLMMRQRQELPSRPHAVHLLRALEGA